MRVFVANLMAGGVGLNLTAARQVVFNDLDWVPANHWQAEDRAYRIGQTATVNVTYFSAEGTVDEFVSHALQREGVAHRGGGRGHVARADRLRICSRSSSRCARRSRLDRDARRCRERRRSGGPVAARGDAGGGGSESVHGATHGVAAALRQLPAEAIARARARAERAGGAAVSRAEQLEAGGVLRARRRRRRRDLHLPRDSSTAARARHARELKAALASGQSVPAGYEVVTA